jgi:hypothetical protein
MDPHGPHALSPGGRSTEQSPQHEQPQILQWWRRLKMPNVPRQQLQNGLLANGAGGAGEAAASGQLACSRQARPGAGADGADAAGVGAVCTDAGAGALFIF